jgi:hypothetical protein
MVSAEMPDDGSPTVGAALPAAAAYEPLANGQEVAGRYRISARLGSGGAAVVYEAFDRITQGWLALKVLDLPGWPGSASTESLFRELRYARSVQHPNVCRVYDVFESEGRFFLAMERAGAGTLRTTLHEHGADRPIEDKMQDARAIVAGLAAIHRAGLVHRDLKPENVLRLDDGRLVVSDFGITRALGQTVTRSRLTGTPGYIAPEALDGAEVGQTSDVWSLGVVLHELLSGERPHWDGVRCQPALPPTRDPREQALARICRACLDMNPARRPHTAVQVERWLARALRPPSRARRLARRAAWLLLLPLALAPALLLQRLQPAAEIGPCGREAREVCGYAGAVCERWPDTSEHCRWKDVPQESCGLLASRPLQPPNQGLWTTASAPGVTGGRGACLIPAANLCRMSEWQLCQRYSAVACESGGMPMCRWRSDQADCNVHRDKTCWGMWTPAQDAAGSPANGVPTGEPGACITQISNLTGTPCP